MTNAKKKRARTAPAPSPVKMSRQTGLSFVYGDQSVDWSSESPLRFDISVSAGTKSDSSSTLIQNLTRGNLIELRDLFDFAIVHTDQERVRHGK